MSNLGRLAPRRKSGTEALHHGGRALQVDVQEFWRWSVSDLVSNTTRGMFAEFIVARALGISVHEVRDEWGRFDLLANDAVRIQVKSAAYVQSWHQKCLSRITFDVSAKRGWNADTNVLDAEPARHADVYVFALLAHMDKATTDPLDLDQWQFFVVATRRLNERKRSQESITLKSLQNLSGGGRSFEDLKCAVRQAAKENRCQLRISGQ